MLGPAGSMMKRELPGLSPAELSEILGSRARATAVVKWLCSGPPPALLPTELPGVARERWAALRAVAEMPPWRLIDRRPAADGTIKYAIDFAGAVVETVLIPSRGRSTVCLSSQAGCTRDCVFCATAEMPYTRNLSAAEMLVQFLVAQAGAPAAAPARNVVFMGMGEPMDNLDQVLAAIERLTQQPAPRLAAAHVTVSTSGVVPGMRRFLAESRALLALSLNATTDEQRAEIMPQTRRWPIAELLDALRAAGRPVFVEYVLFDGVNDRDEDARRLPALLDGVEAHVNLIPHNPVSGSPLRPPPTDRVRRFQRQVQAGGLRCLVRWPRGGDVAAACGQLVRLGRDAVDRGGPAARPPVSGRERETNSA